jgi:hypothetical protein
MGRAVVRRRGDDLSEPGLPSWAGTTRLFADAGPDAALDLAESRSTPKGVMIQVYRPTGRPKYETAAPE